MAQVDIATPRLPRRCRGQQAGGAGTQYVAVRTQLEHRLLACPAHERTAAETFDRLAQTTLELVTLDLPGNVLHARLESQCAGRQAGEQGQQG